MSKTKQKEDIEMQEPLTKQKRKGKKRVDESELESYNITRAAHPFVCFFHLCFKAGAFLSYLFGGLILSSVYKYIAVILFDAADFYMVKNISGKLLVGLRWYSAFGKNGQEIWKFESFDLSKRSKIDQSIFWTFQYGASAGWAFFVFTNVMSLGIVDIVLASVGMTLSWINVWGYYKCSKDQQKKMKGVSSWLGKKGAGYMMRGK